ALADRRVQVGALDELRRDVEQTAVLARAEDRDHVGVPDRGGQARLALEARPEALVARELARDHLQSDGSLERDVSGPVHDPHAAAARETFDPVAGNLRPERKLARRHPRPRSTDSRRYVIPR